MGFDAGAQMRCHTLGGLEKTACRARRGKAPQLIGRRAGGDSGQGPFPVVLEEVTCKRWPQITETEYRHCPLSHRCQLRSNATGKILVV